MTSKDIKGDKVTGDLQEFLADAVRLNVVYLFVNEEEDTIQVELMDDDGNLEYLELEPDYEEN